MSGDMKERYSYRNTSIRKNVSGRHLLDETRCSEFYEFRHEVSGRSLLVVSKYQVCEKSEEENVQVNYLHKMVSVPANEPFSILEYGIDSEGYGYCILEWFESLPLTSDISVANSVLSAFIKCTTAVNFYHEHDLVIGELSISSFRTVSGREVLLLPCLGAYEKSSKRTINISNSLITEYISPEQKINGESSKSSDIYSLGVLGYYLATGVSEKKDMGSGEASLLRRVPAPSITNTNLPEWYDKLIGNCIIADPARRVKSTSDVLDLLKTGIDRGVIDLPEVKWQALDLIKTSNGSIVRHNDNTSIASSSSVSNALSTGNKNSSKAKKNRKNRKRSSSNVIVLLIWISTIVIGSGIALILFVSFKYISITPDELSREVRLIYDEMGSGELRDNLLIHLDESIEEEKRIASLRKIIGKKISWDATLAEAVSKNSYAPVMAKEYVDIFEKHAKELGYISFIDNIVSYLSSISEFDILFKNLSLIFSAMDPAELPESRLGAMRRLFSHDSELSFKVVALLAKESSPHVFLPLLRDFTITKYYKQVSTEVSMPVLFLLPPPVRELVDDVDVAINNLSDEELKELLRIVLDNESEKNDRLNDLVITHYVERFELNPFEKYFLTMAKEQGLSSSFRRVFHKIAFSTVTYNDLSVFFEWNDTRWEEVMYRLCIVSKDEKILNHALDILSRRGPRIKQAESLVKWIKAKFWSRRASYAYSIGILALKDESTEEEIEEAFLRLMPVSQHGLFTALVETGDPYFITQAAERLSAILTSEEVIPYLSHEIREVRIASVRALIGKNDLPTLQKIQRAYRKEKDPEIRELYNKYHWVTVDQEIPDSLKKNSYPG
jgi:hypothetical protein